MKYLSLIIALYLFNNNVFAQSCCNINADGMVAFADNKEFQMSHQIPMAYTHTSEVGGQMINFGTADNTTANGYLIKAKNVKSKKYLFVYQEWWGLNDHIKKMADKFYNDLNGEVNVLAVDMYDGQVATTREQAGKLMGGAKPERLDAIMKGAINYAGKKAKIGTVGWCFGGGLSLKSALLEGKKAKACVMYYGMPVKDVAQLKTLKTDVLGIFAAREKWISQEVVREFEANMKAAGKKVTVHNFDNEHGFSNPSNPIFDQKAADEAYGYAINYLKNKLL